MANRTPTKPEFPREGMSYEDRFRMTVGKFGRRILIELNRGTAKCSDDGKSVIITYSDAARRKPKKG
jgi:hypothetical protein